MIIRLIESKSYLTPVDRKYAKILPKVWYDEQIDRYVSTNYLIDTYLYYLETCADEAEELSIHSFEDYMDMCADMDSNLIPIGDSIEDDDELNDEDSLHIDAVEYGVLNSINDL